MLEADEEAEDVKDVDVVGDNRVAVRDEEDVRVLVAVRVRETTMRCA